MSFIEKKVNQVLNWENIELSVREMTDVIQKELLESCSDKDLEELEKGMNKGWILGVGAPNRYYPSVYQEAKLRLKYNILLHTIQEITLQDSKNKKEYFIPRGKKYCDQLRRTVLRRIENERERRKKPSRNSVQRESGDSSPHFDAVLPSHQSTSRLMLCRSCGNKLSGNALFCSSCGQFTLQERPKKPSTVSEKKGKYRRKKRSRIKPVLCVVGVVVLCVGILGIGLSLIHFPELGANTDEIAVVQNGYLGEYTDISVKEILGSYYGMLYEKEEWDSGATDSGAQIVQARYYDEGIEEDATTIQFTMLNEECFKISAFVDPLNPVEKATDMFAAMNYNYILAYVAENQSVVDDPLAENGFITRISKISASAVQYGASADYSGNRANICELDGQTPLDVSVAMLLDNYGLLDMSYYWGANVFEVPSTTETDKTISSPELPVAEETLGAQEEVVYLLDLVNGTTGSVVAHLGANIVYSGGESGSNTFYHSSNPDVYYSYIPHDWDNPEMQGDEPITAIRVEGNTPISINLTANMTKAELDSVAWNTPNIQNVYVETYYNQLLEETICSYRIETSNAYITFEWYLDRGDGVEYPASSVGISPRVENDTKQTVSTNNISLEGYVIESSGGLRIRSGPGTSYEEVGRLEPLEKVIIQEIQSDGTRDWGRIDRGWICMDYVEEGTPRTISNYDVNVASIDIVSGEYFDSTQNVGIKITTDANGEYLLSYSASGVTLNNIPLRFYNQNTPTDKMLMFDLGTNYPGYSGYVEFVVTGSSWYSYNSLIDGLDDSYGDYFSIEKIS